MRASELSVLQKPLLGVNHTWNNQFILLKINSTWIQHSGQIDCWLCLPHKKFHVISGLRISIQFRFMAWWSHNGQGLFLKNDLLSKPLAKQPILFSKGKYRACALLGKNSCLSTWFIRFNFYNKIINPTQIDKLINTLFPFTLTVMKPLENGLVQE